MQIAMSRNLFAFTLVVAAALFGSPIARFGILSAQDVGRSGNDSWVLVAPTRRAPDGSASAPPRLPPAADRLTPLTLETLIRRDTAAGPAQTFHQTVSRTADRVHLATSNRREWLFERNVRDPRRVSGFLVDHAERAIIEYAESDLRMMLGVRGWADVVMLGFDIDLLGGYKPSPDARTIGGIRFQLYETERKDSGMRQLWWNEEHLLPSGVVFADASGATRLSITNARAGVNTDLLRTADSRFPAYRVYTLAEWLEGPHR
jgi:hypothetical protein